MSDADFARRFATAFGVQDVAGLVALLHPEGSVLTLCGQWAEGRAEAEAAFADEAAGLCARARLVTGKGQLLGLGPQTTLLRQRFVVTGAVDAEGGELPRFGAILVAVLVDGLAISLTFTALP